MGRGRDLTSNERTIVGMNVKRFWNYDKKQINHGKIKDIMKLCAASGVTCGKTVVQDISRGKRRRRETGTSVDLSINLDDYDRCVAFLTE